MTRSARHPELVEKTALTAAPTLFPESSPSCLRGSVAPCLPPDSFTVDTATVTLTRTGRAVRGSVTLSQANRSGHYRASIHYQVPRSWGEPGGDVENGALRCAVWYFARVGRTLKITHKQLCHLVAQHLSDPVDYSWRWIGFALRHYVTVEIPRWTRTFDEYVPLTIEKWAASRLNTDLCACAEYKDHQARLAADAQRATAPACARQHKGPPVRRSVRDEAGNLVEIRWECGSPDVDPDFVKADWLDQDLRDDLWLWLPGPQKAALIRRPDVQRSLAVLFRAERSAFSLREWRTIRDGSRSAVAHSSDRVHQSRFLLALAATLEHHRAFRAAFPGRFRPPEPAEGTVERREAVA